MLADAHHQKAGAVVLFSGEARNHNDGKSVQMLEYEANIELAESVMSEIINSAREKFGLHYAHCVHRIGKVDISESAVCVVTSASHRKEAYDGNKYIIDRVKAEAPIWKKEYFTDGNTAWGENKL